MPVELVKKDPGDMVEYSITIVGLETDVIQTVTAEPDGVVLQAPAGLQALDWTDSEITVWLSGGTAQSVGSVELLITTASGRIFSRKLSIPISEL